MRRTRFTLIELLIVVAIIAILAAILLPALNRAKDTAYTAKCLSNQRQAHVATMLYCDDFDGYFPKVARTDKWLVAGGFPFDANVWQEVLGRLYVDAGFPTNPLDWGGGRAMIFECPTADKWRKWKISQGFTLYEANDYSVDYGISHQIIRCHWTDSFIARPVRISSVTENIIYLADTVGQHLFSNPSSLDYGVRNGHLMDRAANFTFTDGSAETSKEYGYIANMNDAPWNNPYWD